MYKTVVTIEGMMCGMCEAHINDCVRKAVPVKKVSSSHSSGRCEILSESLPDVVAIKKAITETGYTVKDITTNEEEKKPGLFGKIFNR